MSFDKSEIVQFYKNQTIFLTGGTGLVGKLLIEKLLRTCWKLNKIYVLVRAKRGKTPKERFNDFIDSPVSYILLIISSSFPNFQCFELIKFKNFKDKLVLVKGDCNQPNLGLSDEDIKILTEETTCVLHAAANVRLDQSLKEVTNIVKATRDLLELAKKMRQLKVFVFVSTAYSNCNYSHIKEEIYEPPMKAETLLDLVNSLTEEQINKITLVILDKRPYTYVYAKSIAEDVIKTASAQLPTVIIRPSIITSTANEPIKGWIEKPAGLIATIFWAYLGFLHSLPCVKYNKLDLVPADFVCNCILAAAWKKTLDKSTTCTVYNNVGEKVDCEYINHVIDSNYFELASTKYVWKCTYKMRDNKYAHYLAMYLYLLPFYFLDLLSLLFGKPMKALKNYNKINAISEHMFFVPCNHWEFDTKNVENLWNDLNDADKKIFKFYEKIANLDNYFRNCILGMRLYLFKDPLETLPEAKAKTRILIAKYYLFYIVLITIFCVLLKLLINLCW